MDLEITEKVALITGGSHGIGLSTALALAQEGCRIAICSRSNDRLTNAVSKIQRQGADALAIQADVLVPGEIEKTVRSVIGKWGSIHILVNNVGGGGRWGSPVVEETPDEVWLDVYNKNAMAAVRFTRLVIPHMRQQKWGRIVTVASVLGKEGGGRPWFNMAKSAEISLMKTLAMTHDLVRDGITFNSVAPGHIMIDDTGTATEQKNDPQGFTDRLHNEFPLGRMGTPEEVADAIAFLCSERASLINGASIAVDGGESRSF